LFPLGSGLFFVYALDIRERTESFDLLRIFRHVATGGELSRLTVVPEREALISGFEFSHRFTSKSKMPAVLR
jgi:hypothetical protein